ncbi:hypothetical protein OS188_11365 [Xanthomarina sp. F1114]|uniref:hypothetical protein n=1 Tax=Xanthomarina sp. F1114 TaxID=2996019 RepID=UPI00225E5551|nr:hypothetical protein [Xanthomarina sp. F1114]MCX7548550.1 hypothetical protein [Xanthomarina sp. F1114]
MRRLKYLSLLLSIVLLTSCSSSDDDSAEEPIATEGNALILNKWWYDSNGFTADLYFDSDGSYEQRLDFSGSILTTTGTWLWLDVENSIVKIENLSQIPGQLNTELWLKLTNIEQTTMTVQQSSSGESYSAEVSYQDVDPE